MEENEQEPSSDNSGSDHDDIDTTTAQGNTIGSTRRKKYLTNKQRQKIYEDLLERCVISKKTGKLTQKKHSIAEVASKFNVTMKVVQSIWRIAKRSREADEPVDVSSKRVKNCGRKRVDVDLSQMHLIPYNNWTTIRSCAEALHVSKSKRHKLFKEGLIRRHTN